MLGDEQFMIKIPETEVYIGGGHKGHLFLTKYDEDGWWIIEDNHCDSLHSIYNGLKMLAEQTQFTYNNDVYLFFNRYFPDIKTICKYLWTTQKSWGKCYNNVLQGKCEHNHRIRYETCDGNNPFRMWSIDFKYELPEPIEDFPIQYSPKFLSKNTPEGVDVRKTKEYRVWRKTILKRDGCCVVCGHDNKLEAHHLFGFKEHSDIATDMGNGVTLCKWCHQKYHSIYGTQNINPVDFIRFKDRFGVRL